MGELKNKPFFYGNEDDYSVLDFKQSFRKNKMVLVIDNGVDVETLPDWFIERPEWSYIISISKKLNDSERGIINNRFSSVEMNDQTSRFISASESLRQGNDRLFIKADKFEQFEQQQDLIYVLQEFFRSTEYMLMWIGTEYNELIIQILNHTLKYNENNKRASAKLAFFGAGEETEAEKLLKSELINNYAIAVYRYNPYHYFEEEELFSSDESDYYDDSDLFYISNEPIMTDQLKDKITACAWVSLVTDVSIEMHLDELNGKRNRKISYRRFLEKTYYDCTQWYGYHPKAEYYIKRNYCDQLLALVKMALNKRISIDNAQRSFDNSGIIVLKGAPMSSKSATLGYIAYKIYCEHCYPVLVIKQEIEKNKEIISYDRKESLDRLIEAINDISPIRVLVIWDGHETEEIDSVIKYLADRGRKFVFVYCEYGNFPSQNSYVYSDEKKTLISVKGEKNGMIAKVCEKWYVRADRKDEKYSGGFKKIFREFFYEDFDVDNETLKKWDTFDYFYVLDNKLRPRIADSLRNENTNMLKSLEAELDSIFKDSLQKKTGTLGSMIDFKKLGLEYDQKDDVNNELLEMIKRFQMCVAVFSAFDNGAPEALAMGFLDKSIANGGTYYSTDRNDGMLYSFASESIPWIRRKRIDDDFYFEFRNIIEARLYIEEKMTFGESKDTNPLKIDFYDFIKELIELYCCRDIPSRIIVNSINALLINVGPNSRLKKNREYQFPFDAVKSHLDLIITELEKPIKKQLDYYDRLLLTKLSFQREYYSMFNLRDYDIEKCENACNELRNIITEEMNIIERAESNNSVKIRNSFINELANAVYSYLENKAALIKSKGDNEKLYMPIDIQFLAGKLNEAICAERTNGYYYNALLKLFNFYTKHFIKDVAVCHKLSIMIFDLLSCSEGIEIANKGSTGDEFDSHKTEFYSYLEGVEINIEDVENNTENFIKISSYFKNNGESLIYLVCAKEFNKCIKSKFNCLDKLGKIFELMYGNTENYNKLKTNTGAMQLLFRVVLLKNMQKDVFDKDIAECSEINMKIEQWNILNEIGQNIIKSSRANNYRISTQLAYLYAVSCIYAKEFRAEGFEECRRVQQQYLSEKNYEDSTDKRMKTKLILCRATDGDEPRITGKVIDYDCKKNSGLIEIIINGETIRLTSEEYFSITKESLGLPPDRIKKDRLLSMLRIGVGNTRCRVYSKEGLSKIEKRRQR